MGRVVTLLTLAVLVGSGCAKAVSDSAKMIGTWRGGTPELFRTVANSDTIHTHAVFKEDGKMEIVIADDNGESLFKGEYELKGEQLTINLIGFGGMQSQSVRLDGDEFTMESVTGRITFKRE